MSRLTCRFDGTACFKERDEGDFVPCGECYTTCKKCAFAMCLNKLAAYEDIELDPEELQEIVDKQKWHVVAEGDLPEEKGFYQCTLSNNHKDEVFIADVYNAFSGFFFDHELYEVLAWRELPEPWEGVEAK